MVDWSQPAADVYNLIRGCNPQPGASTTRGGETLKLFDAGFDPGREDGGSDAAPGTVTEINDAGFSVAASGGQILVKRVQPPKSRKVPAAEWAAEAGLEVGEVLGG